jgi:hypothetical protein
MYLCPCFITLGALFVTICRKSCYFMPCYVDDFIEASTLSYVTLKFGNYLMTLGIFCYYLCCRNNEI